MSEGVLLHDTALLVRRRKEEQLVCVFFKCWGSSRCFEICIEAGNFTDLKVQLLWSVWQKQEGCSSGRIFSLGFYMLSSATTALSPAPSLALGGNLITSSSHLLFPLAPTSPQCSSLKETFFSSLFLFFFPHSCLMKSCVFTCFLCKLKHFQFEKKARPLLCLEEW